MSNAERQILVPCSPLGFRRRMSSGLLSDAITVA
jgi:hypothetical protein